MITLGTNERFELFVEKVAASADIKVTDSPNYFREGPQTSRNKYPVEMATTPRHTRDV